MGIFGSLVSGIGGVISGAASTVATDFENGMDNITAAITHPITAVTQGITAAKTQYNSSSQLANDVQIVQNTAVAAGLVLSAGTAAGALTSSEGIVSGATKLLTSVGSTVVSHPLMAAEGLLTVGALSADPDLPAQTTTAFLNYGNQVGQVMTGSESISQAGSNIWNEATQHPLLTTGAVLVGGAAVAAGYDAISSAVSSLLPSVNDAGNAVAGALPSVTPTDTTLPSSTSTVQPQSSAVTSPAALPVQTTTKRKKRRHSVKSKPTQTINRQTVNIYE
jgi:hypothetical protein